MGFQLPTSTGDRRISEPSTELIVQCYLIIQLSNWYPHPCKNTLESRLSFSHMLVFWRLLFVWSSFPSPCQDLVQLRSCCRRLQAELTASRCLSEPEPGAVFFTKPRLFFFVKFWTDWSDVSFIFSNMLFGENPSDSRRILPTLTWILVLVMDSPTYVQHDSWQAAKESGSRSDWWYGPCCLHWCVQSIEPSWGSPENIDDLVMIWCPCW